MSKDPYSDDYHDPLATGANPEEEPAVAGGKPMGFLEHLEDLRWTLIKCAAVFAVFVAIIGYYLQDASALLNAPLEEVKPRFPDFKLDLVTTTPMGIFSVIISMCVMGGVVLALPFWLYFFGQFVAPALTKREMKVLLPTAFAAFALFLGGASFGYFLLVPKTIEVSLELNQVLGTSPMWTADRYYSLLLWFVLGVGAAFEFPLLIVLASYMGLVEVATLRKYRRHAIVAFFIIAAVVTPTPDPFVQTLFAVPLCVLYEIAIWVSAWLGRRKGTAP
ncbi:MAG TPA: twin-arginine translocase subunit TatC [Opitutaceae bacterium]|nr:twin-arginine translocase subunit TatC [Opitutaceae bacterium]